MASMSSREKRRKRKRKREASPESNPTPESSSQRKREASPESNPAAQSSSPIPSLPYDLVLLCVARVSRLYYPTLSLVSKSFRSLLSSPELYKTRSLFGFTESCLYVCLQDLRGSSTWYTLCRKPDKTLKTGSSGYALSKVPVPNSPIWRCSNVVAVGSNIYNIAFPRSLNVLPRVSILDCKSHTWIEAPSLPVELHSFSASVVDHKIYVAGLDHRLKKNSFEVFDTETQIWDSMSTSNTSVEREGIEREGMFIKKTISIDGKFHVVTDGEVLAYDPKLAKWDMVGRGMRGLMYSEVYCVIGNVLYSAKEETLFRDSNESGLHYWNYNGYAIGRTRNCAGSQGCTIARAGDNVAIALQGTDANQLEFHVHHAKEAATVVKLAAMLDPKTGEPTKKSPRCLTAKQSAMLEVSLHYPVCVETFSESRALGRVRPARPQNR
ncbi:hypothetical protein Bca101_000457 [Brassica carinata]